MWPFKKKEPEKKKDTYSKTVYSTYTIRGWVGWLEANPMDAEITKTHKFVEYWNDDFSPSYHARGGEIIINRANITHVIPVSVDALAEYEYEKD